MSKLNEPESSDEHYSDAVKAAIAHGTVSIVHLQRKFSINYNRAALLIDHMEANGVVSSPAHNGHRTILI